MGGYLLRHARLLKKELQFDVKYIKIGPMVQKLSVFYEIHIFFMQNGQYFNQIYMLIFHFDHLNIQFVDMVRLL